MYSTQRFALECFFIVLFFEFSYFAICIFCKIRELFVYFSFLFYFCVVFRVFWYLYFLGAF